MKKTIFLLAIVIMLTTALTSCDSADDIIYESEIEITDSDTSAIEITDYDIELAKLYNSIDSLHNVYSTLGSTRVAPMGKWERRILFGIADSCVGTLTGISGIGAILCGALASWTLEDYFDAQWEQPTQANYAVYSSVSLIQKTVVFQVESPSFVDSIGYYHNIFLDEVRSKGASYIDDNSYINYNAYYNDVVAAANKHGISDNSSINKPQIFKYIDSIIKPLTNVETISQENILSIIFNETYNDFNYDNSKTTQLRNIYEKIIYNDLCVNENKVVEYGNKVNELIVNSNVDNNTKQTMKIANNIAINSYIYWTLN